MHEAVSHGCRHCNEKPDYGFAFIDANGRGHFHSYTYYGPDGRCFPNCDPRPHTHAFRSAPGQRMRR